MLGNKPPYTTMQQLNLDWVLSKLKTLLRLVPDDGAVGQILRRTRDGAVWSDEQGGGGGAVQSVNGKTGAVVLDADDVGALPDDYTPPVTSVNGQTGAVVVSVPVQSVNGKTGAVLLDADDVSALPDDYTPPVTSVNGQTGAVLLDAADVGALPDDYTPPVTSVNGQTGAVTVGEYTRVLLWTNPNVSGLAAGIVNVDMTGYDNIEIECTETGNPPQRTYYVKCPIGTDTTAAQITLTTFFFNRDLSGYGALGVMSRYADIYLHGINFGSGDMLYNGTYYQNWDNRAVPYRIWGIKY